MSTRVLRASALLIVAASLFVACSEDANPAPGNPTFPTTGGAGGSAGTGSSGAGTAGSSVAGSSGTGGAAAGGGGAGAGGSGQAGAAGGKPCEQKDGCSCGQATLEDFLNHCSDAQCVGFDDAGRLPLYNGGDLPPIP